MFFNLPHFFGKINGLIGTRIPLLLLLSALLVNGILLTASFLGASFAPPPGTLPLIAGWTAVGLALIYGMLRLILWRLKQYEQAISSEYAFYNLIINHTNDMIVLLNNLGVITHCNPAFCEGLKLDRAEISGMPFRNIFSLSDSGGEYNYKLIILEKLKEAFQGRETEIIAPIKVKGMEHLQTVYLKLTPLYKNKELELIFIMGRLMQSDFITNNWLENENSRYLISNDLTLSNKFCYRLTRNLDGKLSSSEVLLIQIAIQEVIINAIEHGNLELTYEKKTELKKKGGNYFEQLIREANSDYLNSRKVLIEYLLEKDQVRYIIRDQGRGFDWKKYFEAEEFSTDIMTTYHGVGLQLVRSAFNEVLFNETGNEITLIKYFTAPGGKDHAIS